MSNLVDFAKEELARIDHSDDMQCLIDRDILELIETFSNQEHSDTTGAYVLGMFNRLVTFMPLTPLTGEDDEWEDISDISGDTCYQNKRCSRIFKDKDSRAYDSTYRYFVDENGWSYINKDSREYISFPYCPNEPLKEKEIKE